MKDIVDFLYRYFHTYDITTEVVMIGIIFILATISFYSKPEKTYMTKYYYRGLFFSAVSMIFHIWMLGETIRMQNTHNFLSFYVLYLLFSVSFICVLELLFIYHSQLSFVRRSMKKQLRIICCIIGIFWLGILLLPMFTGKMLEYKDGRYVFTFYSNAYVLCSFTCLILITYITLRNKKNVARIVHCGSMIFIPLEFLAVSSQLYFPTAYFICATYTLPFLIYFLLFHCQKYDEITGCQGPVACRTILKKYITSRREFIIFNVTAPTIETRNLAEIRSVVYKVINDITRSIERVDRRIKVYGINVHSYAIFCPVKDDFEAEDIKERLIEVLTAPVLIGDSYKKIAMNILFARRFETIQSVDEMLLLMKIKGKQFYNLGIDQILEVTEADAEKCRRYTFIEKNLLDIRYSRNIDDSRVLVYVQPIYDIKTGTFRTGESLMRLKIDDEIIYPDEFIPIAENSGSIHSLTRIMLYKVSKKIAELSQNFDFEAITVNVSTVELAIPNVSEEFMGIIMRSHARPEKIRFEITESTNIKNYEPVISNIKRINELGVCFYLDDFGTGYSNLDRVISIPFMTIKFDKSLLYKSMEDKKSEELLMFMVRFFKSNDYKLVIEGVEDVIQKQYVERIGFDYIQGYLYSRPLPIDELERFFDKKSID